ncbi:sulfate transporter family-domain-containing protein [Desarmillaria tabescens]|uniref:Sulfate transporter family-domain-containing protein n=1 Tax=Armillaria tabescens TaxID=1929756 RepID=A0AA39MYV8_ARMTA|nr:sulfate transporter family-domain-containing protein [Desarmillaria tabescens]KAK0451278.1 sulfate transporter family-domain-containing protein [Desarmillaria tabescens]
MSLNGESPLSRAGLLPGPSSVPSVAHTQMSIRAKTVQLSSNEDEVDLTYTPSPPASPNETTSLLTPAAQSLRNSIPKAPSRISQGQPRVLVFLLETVQTSLKSIPAVILGSLLNILDGVSYGMIIFPASGVFDEYQMAPIGVSMFFLSTLTAQLTYTLGASQFPGANGSMMIEVVPFFHMIALSISADLESPTEILATTLVSYALSSVLTGIAFFLLGYLKLGTLIGFFPRHILVGCIGGVGAFLVETGLEVSLSLTSTSTSTPLPHMFTSLHNIILWGVPLFLAIFLRVGMWLYGKMHKGGDGEANSGIFVGYFIAIPVIFYVVVLAAGIPMDVLRKNGWVFDVQSGNEAGWYKFYGYFGRCNLRSTSRYSFSFAPDFTQVRFKPLWDTLPTQFALLFFNILHPPLNVPALSISLNEDDIDTNKELVAHGYSNLFAGLIGTVPNYLVYVNTLLFYRVGGTTRISGFLLAAATAVLLAIGTGFVGYIPVMVVGALIFVLGIDLVKEAIWDTRGRVSRSEYITIISIMVCMTVWDFVIGVLFGIIVCCLFFVIQTSRLSVIRALHTGSTAPSTVRRPSVQRAYIREVSGKQTCVMRLGGFMFFGNVTEVEEGVRRVLGGAFEKDDGYGSTRDRVETPGIRFLVLDLTHVAGVDMSAIEGLVRVRRMLEKKGVCLVMCGVRRGEGPVGKALDVFFGDEAESEDPPGAVEAGIGSKVEVFDTFGDAMEWTENAYLKAWFKAQKVARSVPFLLPGRQDADVADYSESGLGLSMLGSPRIVHLYDAGSRTIANELYPSTPPSHDQASIPSLSLGGTPPRLLREPASGRDRGHLMPPHEFPNHPLREPFPTLSRALSPYTSLDLSPLPAYLSRVCYPAGHVLWRQNDPPDGLYIIEKGVLRASYAFESWSSNTGLESSSHNNETYTHPPHIEESMVSGTVAGELSALSNMPRNATMVVERDVVLWKLGREALGRMQEEKPIFAKQLVEAILKSAKIDYDILLAALATRQ